MISILHCVFIKYLYISVLLLLIVESYEKEKILTLTLSKKTELNKSIRTHLQFGNLKDNKNYPQNFDLIIDILSPTIWLPSNKSILEDSSIPKYKKENSTAVVPLNKSLAIVEAFGELYGELINETVILDDYYEILVKNITMFLVDSFTHYIGNHKNGKLGLGMPTSNKYYNTSSIIEQLFNNKLIDNKIFVLDNENLYIGKIPDKYKNLPISNCTITKKNDLDEELKNGYVCEMSHIIISDNNKKTFKDAYEIYPSRVIFDTMSDYITIPITYYDFFKNYLFRNYFWNECTTSDSDDYTYIICDQATKFIFLNITFIIDGYGYIFSMKNLYRRAKNNKYELLVRFRKENDIIWTFGSPFFNSMNIGFDLDNNAVYMIGGIKESYLDDWINWKSNKTPYINVIQRYLIILAVVIIISFLLILLWFKYNKKNDSRNYLEHGPLIKQEEIS